MKNHTQFVAKTVVILGFILSSLACAKKEPQILSQEAFENMVPKVTMIRELPLQKPIVAREIKREKVGDYIRRRIREDYGKRGLSAEKETLVLLGILKEDDPYQETLVRWYESEISGYYDFAKKRLYLVTPNQGLPIDLTVTHELAHALQDQHFNLGKIIRKLPKDDDDYRGAVNALFEGDAMAVMMDYHSRRQMMDPDATLQNPQPIEERDSLKIPNWVMKMAAFPYTRGMTFVQYLMDRGGYEAVNRAYEKLPQSTEQILHPEKYLQGELPVLVTLQNEWGASGSGWKERHSNTMGEFMLRTLLEEAIPMELAYSAAEGWGGDRYWVIERKAERALVATVVFDSKEDAKEFVQAWGMAYPESRTLQSENSVWMGIQISEADFLQEIQNVFKISNSQ